MGRSTALHRFFSGLVEYIFQSQLGVADPPLTDYVSGLMLRFLRTDAVYRVRNLRGRPVGEVGQMLVEAEERVGDARREVHRHIGDYTLFWAGLYPESLRPRRGPSELDRFVDYCAHGKRAYLIASTIEADPDANPTSELLERLSQHFELCAYGLREIRREWERSDLDGPERPLILD